MNDNLAIYWVKDSTVLQSLTFCSKSALLLGKTVFQRILHISVTEGWKLISVKNCGCFFFEHEVDTLRREPTTTDKLWQQEFMVCFYANDVCNVFVIDVCGIKQWFIWKYTGDLL